MPPTDSAEASARRLLEVIDQTRSRAVLVPGLLEVLNSIDAWVRAVERRLEQQRHR